MNINNRSFKLLALSLLIFSFNKTTATVIGPNKLTLPPMDRELSIQFFLLENTARCASKNPWKQYLITDKPATEADVAEKAQPICNHMNGWQYRIFGDSNIDWNLNHIEKKYGFNIFKICKKQHTSK